MNTLLLLLLIPLITPWIVKYFFAHQITWLEMLATILIVSVLTSGVYFAGKAGMTRDHEIWNGHITKKGRTHGHYLRPYECFCSESCSGSGSNRSCTRTCQTCYEDRYTVTWTAYSTITNFTIEHLDRGSRSVYATPDPNRYVIIHVGDPCSLSTAFTNYIKAVPESLFHASAALQTKFQTTLPAYPGQIYDIYKIDRVLAVGVPLPDLRQWNHELSMILRALGPNKQANVIIVFVKTADQSYQLALESAWLGGKKNDIIVVIGTTNYPAIDWVGVTSWTTKELFKVQLRDAIFEQKTIDREKILTAITQHTNATFVRRSMQDFEYLKDEIEPPLWVLILAVVLAFGTCFGVSYGFYVNDPFQELEAAIQNFFNRFRS